MAASGGTWSKGNFTPISQRQTFNTPYGVRTRDQLQAHSDAMNTRAQALYNQADNVRKQIINEKPTGKELKRLSAYAQYLDDQAHNAERSAARGY